MWIFELFHLSDKNLGFLMIVFVIFIIYVLIYAFYLQNERSIQKNKEKLLIHRNQNTVLKYSGEQERNEIQGEINNTIDQPNILKKEKLQSESMYFGTYLLRIISIFIFLIFLNRFSPGRVDFYSLITLFLCIVHFFVMKNGLYKKIFSYVRDFIDKIKKNFPKGIQINFWIIRTRIFLNIELLVILSAVLFILIFILFGVDFYMYLIFSILTIHGSYIIQPYISYIIKKYITKK